MSESDLLWMCRALELAEQGRGVVEPNPLVGAVVVRGQQVVGEGWHQRFGEAHAEVNALAQAGAAAAGATLYVTLEPCCHQGKTPPCTDAILQAGVRRVVAAMTDPFPQVASQGVALLRGAGVEVEVGAAGDEARRQNAPYLKLLATGRPYVHAKWAMTLDGKIATRTGDSRWISNEASRRRVHALRGRMDAIVVGLGTVLADDPLLNARPPGPRTALRLVLDSKGRLPSTCQLVKTAGSLPTVVAVVNGLDQGRGAEIAGLGCQVIPLPAERGWVSIPALLEELGKRRLTNVLVEGGAAVLGSFLDAGAIDEVHVFIAPRLAGGANAKTPIEGVGVGKIAEGLTLDEWNVERIEGDLLLHGWTSKGS